ncbi:MAG: cell division protein FtsA [Candidatus Gracilibacteria bacterium]|nr:cell division protein FtsA [Candidatus Gracilibacteria bacterium]
MSFDNIITSIDIGGSKIKTVIGRFDENDKNKFAVLGVGVVSSNAIRKGNILDMDEFKQNLDKSLEEAERMAGEQVAGAYISFNSSSIEVVNNKGIIAVSGDEIKNDDIIRVLDMARNGVELPNREILKVIPDSFTVDLEEGIKSPVGMTARKLEVRANIFSIGTNVLNNIKKAISDVGIEVLDIYPNIISAPEGVLTKRQKELGVVCIDIGSSTTGISVYEEGSLKFASIIPMGGDSVTNDIALGIRTSIDTAEKLKLEFGSLALDRDESFKDVELDLAKITNNAEEGVISKKYLSQIITARYDEIIHFVKDELKRIGRDGMLPEGAVIVGGAAKMKGLVDLTKEVLRLPTIVGLPTEKDVLSGTFISDPSFASVIGAMILANRHSMEHTGLNINMGNIFASIVKVFKKLVP